MIWLTEYYRLVAVTERFTFGKVVVPRNMLWLGQISCINGVIAVASIDTGKMNNSLHGTTAVIFFFGTMFTAELCNGCLKELQMFRNELVSSKSLRLKRVIGGLMYVDLVICLISTSLNHHHNIFFYIFNATEWVAMALILSYIFTFVLDWEELLYVLKFPDPTAAPQVAISQGVPINAAPAQVQTGFVIGLDIPMLNNVQVVQGQSLKLVQ